MSKLKIGIVISTTRATRFGHKPAEWVKNIAAERNDMAVEILDLRDYPMPFFDEVASNAWVPTTNEVAQRWQKKVAEFDGFIFVTAEYNHGIPAVLKNALDYAYPEWNKKAAALVGYGAVGGSRAVEQLRLVAAELQLATIRTGVYIQGADFMAALREGKDLKEIPHLQQGVRDMLDQLAWWTASAQNRAPAGCIVRGRLNSRHSQRLAYFKLMVQPKKCRHKATEIMGGLVHLLSSTIETEVSHGHRCKNQI